MAEEPDLATVIDDILKDGFTLELDGTGGRGQNGRENIQQCRFPRPVRTYEDLDILGVDFEVHTIKNCELAELFGNLPGFKNRKTPVAYTSISFCYGSG